MKKRGKIYRKSLLNCSILMVLTSLQSSSSQAQEQALSQRDSIGYRLNIDILNRQFLIAGDPYKINKYKLQPRPKINADSLFTQCIDEYQKILDALPQQKQPGFFSENFYIQVIPVIQYFRNAFLLNRFEADRQRLHPREAEPDPKHHEHEADHDHKEL